MTSSLLVSGFRPFNGRNQNASWLCARGGAARRWHAKAVDIPVIWGAPKEVDLDGVDAWLAMGEAKDEFRFETSARNGRKPRPDVTGELPGVPCVDSSVDVNVCLACDVDCHAMAAQFQAKTGILCRTSDDAGQYLCEEALFTGLQWALKDEARVAAFLHVPVVGATVTLVDGSTAVCDEAMLERAGEVAIDCLMDAAKARRC